MVTRALIFDDQFVHSRPDGLAGTEPFALFLRALCQCFAHTTLLARDAPCASLPRYPLPIMQHIPLPGYRNVATLCLCFPLYTAGILRQLRSGMRGVDVLFLHWPHPISFLALLLARLSRRRRPICMFARTDTAAVVKHRYTGLSRLLAGSAVSIMERMLGFLQRDVIVFAAGSQLYDLYRRRIPRTYQLTFAYLPPNSSLPPCRATARLRDAPLRLLYVGRLEPEKDVSTLLHAVRNLLDAGDVLIQVEIAGSGTQESFLRSLAETLGIAQLLRFHGHVPFGDAVFDLYRNADLLVLPSRAEGIPHVLFEAMSFGVPVVATAVAAVPTLIRSGENGWLVPAGSSAALADTIRAAANAPEVCAAIALTARVEVEKLLGSSSICTILHAVEAWP